MPVVHAWQVLLLAGSSPRPLKGIGAAAFVEVRHAPAALTRRLGRGRRVDAGWARACGWD